MRLRSIKSVHYSKFRGKLKVEVAELMEFALILSFRAFCIASGLAVDWGCFPLLGSMDSSSKKSMRKNAAFIDSQNLNLSIRELGWALSYRKFYIYLREKYSVEKAFIFLGYVKQNESLYEALRQAGFICVFKPTLTYRDGVTKGNCDAELVLHSMIEYPNYEQAILVTGDGDFHCLARYFITQKKLVKMLIPNQKKYSSLLKRLPSEYLAFMNDLESKLRYEKNPARTEP